MKSFINLCERNYPFLIKQETNTLITTSEVAGTVF